MTFKVTFGDLKTIIKSGDTSFEITQATHETEDAGSGKISIKNKISGKYEMKEVLISEFVNAADNSFASSFNDFNDKIWNNQITKDKISNFSAEVKDIFNSPETDTWALTRIWFHADKISNFAVPTDRNYYINNLSQGFRITGSAIDDSGAGWTNNERVLPSTSSRFEIRNVADTTSVDIRMSAKLSIFPTDETLLGGKVKLVLSPDGTDIDEGFEDSQVLHEITLPEEFSDLSNMEHREDITVDFTVANSTTASSYFALRLVSECPIEAKFHDSLYFTMSKG